MIEFTTGIIAGALVATGMAAMIVNTLVQGHLKECEALEDKNDELQKQVEFFSGLAFGSGGTGSGKAAPIVPPLPVTPAPAAVEQPVEQSRATRSLTVIRVLSQAALPQAIGMTQTNVYRS